MPLYPRIPECHLPPEGKHRAKVVQVTAKESARFKKEICYTFELADLARDDGSRFWVFRSCKNLLTQKTELLSVTEHILGRALTKSELDGNIDLELLIGYVVEVEVVHRESRSGNTYAIVKTIAHVGKADDSSALPF